MAESEGPQTREDVTRKTVYVLYGGDGVEEEFGGVSFQFCLEEADTVPFEHTYMEVNAKIAEESSPNVESCDINYDMLLVNQTDRELSVRQTATCKVFQRWAPVTNYFIKQQDILDDDKGFIVKEKGRKGKKPTKYQVDISIEATNKKMKN